MSHTALRREFSDLIDLDAPVDRLAGGFTFTEGPIWHPRDQYLLFSDMPADVRRRYDERGGVREVMRPSNKCNGMTYDADLGLDSLRARDIEPHSRARRQARGSRLAFRRQGTQQPERRMRALRRLDLFFRSLVRAHAGLRRRAAAPARLPGRLSRSAGRRRAAACGRSQPVRAAERALLLARRAAPLCQRHGACADPRLRCQCRRHARPGPDFCLRHPLRARARRARRHEMRQRRQYLGDGARRRMGLCAHTARYSARCACPNSSPICIGASPIGARCSCAPPTRSMRVRTKIGPRVEPFMRASAGLRRFGSTSTSRVRRSGRARQRQAQACTLDPSRCALIIQDMQNDVMMEGGAFASSGLAAARARAECRREHPPPRRSLPARAA